ncbi:hypothetical protein H5410_013371 [Solanum commersonii]|uniref:Uncharacterized protein n=1 Tax=Solanum commersonii TaxID=4109 RepID=A0A9J6AUY4_SOLCO|nr:hypothetical protein H5410_013371 [Solanum commersonii]
MERSVFQITYSLSLSLSLSHWLSPELEDCAISSSEFEHLSVDGCDFSDPKLITSTKRHQNLKSVDAK